MDSATPILDVLRTEDGGSFDFDDAGEIGGSTMTISGIGLP